MQTSKHWTEVEVNLLLSEYEQHLDMSLSQFAKHVAPLLNRTEGAIKKKLTRICIKSGNPDFLKRPVPPKPEPVIEETEPETPATNTTSEVHGTYEPDEKITMSFWKRFWIWLTTIFKHDKRRTE